MKDIIDRLVKERDLTDEEFEFELAKSADQYGMTLDQIKQAYGQSLGQVRHSMYINKIETYLFENNQ